MVSVNRALWQAIKDSGYTIPDGQRVDQLTAELMTHLGSRDPVLRDDYACAILSAWIEGKIYTPAKLREMALQLVGNLAAGLGDRGADTVFLRSFSALILADIVRQDNRDPFFTTDEVRTLLRWSAEYLLSERDLRAYVRGKGWAFALAHAAELLRQLAKNRHLDRAELEQIMTAVAERVTQTVDTIGVHGEDDRLAAVVWAALQRDLLEMPFLVAWLARLVAVMKLAPPDGSYDAEAYAAYQNTRQLLRSLYFRLALAKQRGPLLDSLRPKVLAAVKAVGG